MPEHLCFCGLRPAIDDQVTGTFEQPSVPPAWDELEEHAVDLAKEAALDALEELPDKEVGEELGGLLRRLRRRD